MCSSLPGAVVLLPAGCRPKVAEFALRDPQVRYSVPLSGHYKIAVTVVIGTARRAVYGSPFSIIASHAVEEDAIIAEPKASRRGGVALKW